MNLKIYISSTSVAIGMFVEYILLLAKRAVCKYVCLNIENYL